MCGRINITEQSSFDFLGTDLGVKINPQPRLNIKPTNPIPIVFQGKSGQRRFVDDACWWLVQKKDEDGHFRPDNRWQTFNSRAAQLGTSKMHKIPPKSFRVVVPVSAFHEWKDRVPNNISDADTGVLALAGVAKYWREAGAFSASIVTLPPHPRFSHIHAKSIPLMLTHQDYEAWLDNDIPSDELRHLWEPHIPVNLAVTPLSDVNTLEPAGKTELIPAD